jgi:hypothetical protein
MATRRYRTTPATLAFAVLVVTFSIAGEILGGARALAVQVRCGDTITADSTLDIFWTAPTMAS